MIIFFLYLHLHLTLVSVSLHFVNYAFVFFHFNNKLKENQEFVQLEKSYIVNVLMKLLDKLQ